MCVCVCVIDIGINLRYHIRERINTENNIPTLIMIVGIIQQWQLLPSKYSKFDLSGIMIVSHIPLSRDTSTAPHPAQTSRNEMMNLIG